MAIKHYLDDIIGRKFRKILDQLLHFLWAAISVIPVMIWGPTVAAGVCSALLFALPREIVDQWPIDSWFDTILDLAFFALGGAVMGMII